MKREMSIMAILMTLLLIVVPTSPFYSQSKKSQLQKSVKLGTFVEIAKGIECTLEISQDGSTTIVRPVLRGKSTLSGPMQVTVNLQKERYEAWAQDVPFIEVEIDVLVDKRWINPAEEAVHVHIRVNPGKENRFFTIRYNTGKTPSRFRLTVVEQGSVYEFKVS